MKCIVPATVSFVLLIFGCSEMKQAEEASPGFQPRSSPASALTCPVSGKPAQKEVSYEYQGKTIHFCCKDCLEPFKKDPEKYLAASRKAQEPAKPQPANLLEGSHSK